MLCCGLVAVAIYSHEKQGFHVIIGVVIEGPNKNRHIYEKSAPGGEKRLRPLKIGSKSNIFRLFITPLFFGSKNQKSVFFGFFGESRTRLSLRKAYQEMENPSRVRTQTLNAWKPTTGIAR